MKTIGLIGGMSWESSIEYYRLINEETRRILGKSNSSQCVMYSVNFQRVEELMVKGEWKKLENEMKRIALLLEGAGCDVILLCTNTMHKFAEVLESMLKARFLHIADVVGAEMVRQNIRTAGLLGTRFTMKEEFYKSRIQEKFGVKVVIPRESDIEIVHRVIFEELVRGIIREESRSEYVRIMDALSEAGCEGIIMGCTEIGLLIKEYRKPLFDTTSLHALAAVKMSLAPAS